MENELRLAVLIDADNISEKYIKIILDETANDGIATYKRIYGDWTSSRMSSWKNALLENSILPMQQYSYTIGKNATDSAMIIDAMDILYSGTVDGFCLVTSDSDFTRLAARLRESGMKVIGMGEEKTPKPFISACNQFKYLDLLYNNQEEDADEAEDVRENDDIPSVKTRFEAGSEKEKGKKKNSGRQDSGTESAKTGGISTDQEKLSKKDRRKNLREIRKAINAILEKFSDDDGWLFSGKLGNELSKRLPDFDVRNYGYSKLTPFINSLGCYELDARKASGGQKHIYVRRRQ